MRRENGLKRAHAVASDPPKITGMAELEPQRDPNVKA